MVTWSGLGHNPVPGDVSAVERVAGELGSAGEQAELLVGTLRGIDSGTGPSVWKGPAADSFRGLLGEVGPQLTGLATAYADAKTATTTYSAALTAAQDKAGRAEADAEQAREDHRIAQREHDKAAADAHGWSVGLRAAEQGLAEAAGLLLSPVALVDPTYNAQLQQWQQKIAQQRAHAETRRAEAIGQQQVAASAMRDADQRLGLARSAADDAANELRRAALRLARVLGVQVSTPRSTLREPDWKVNVDDPKIVINRDGRFLTLNTTRDRSLYEGKLGPVPVELGVTEQSREVTIGQFDDGSFGVGATSSAAAYLLRIKGEKRLGNDRIALTTEGSVTVGADAKVDSRLSVGKDRIEAGAGEEVFFGGEARTKVGLDGAGVSPTVEAAVRYGFGATADADVGYDKGTIKFSAKIGATMGIGGEFDPSVEINVPELAKNVGDGAKGIAKKIGSLLD